MLVLAVATAAVALRRSQRLAVRLYRKPGRPDQEPDQRGRVPGRADRIPTRLSPFAALRERATVMRARRSARRLQPPDTLGIGWVSRPDLQPAQVLAIPGAKTLVEDMPLGLAVTALATDSVGYPPQDVYYVQRNVIALARGLSAVDAGQRFAALALSAVMTSPLGRIRDAEEALRIAVTSANRLIRSAAKREPGYSDMATTLDVVFISFDSGRSSLYFAHVGNSSLWLQRTGSTSVELLTESHTIDGGPPLRAVGLSGSIVPDIGYMPTEPGDRVFLTSASRYFTFTPKIVNAVVVAHAGSSLQRCVAALTDAVGSSAAPEGITIVAAEVARPGSFVP